MSRPPPPQESRPPPPQESRPPTEEQQRLFTLFAEMERSQPDTLDAAGKRIIELVTGLLGVLFAVIAFGDTFPPPYLVHPLPRFLCLVALACYLAAMFMALRVVQPRDYQFYRHNLDGMREELARIVKHKSSALWWAGVLFFIGSVLLGALVGVIVVG
jgi:hypothetical protein